MSFNTMAMGKPLVCIDTTGYTRYFSADTAVIIPRNTREQVIEQMSIAITRLCNKNERSAIGEKAKKAGEQFNWQTRGEEFRNLLLEKFK